MTSVKDVKAALHQVIDRDDAVHKQIQEVIRSSEQMNTHLRAIIAGADPSRIAEAIARTEQSRQRLTDAAAIVKEHAAAVREYIKTLG